jgi:hypothetical protein
MPMQFFSVEWLGDGLISIERDDGTTIQGVPNEILSTLVQVRRRKRDAAKSPSPPG